jgi:diguanylate cyclase (GGDEF)-like protein
MINTVQSARRPSVGELSTTTLPWAVGAFCAAIGVLMLVAPHQFNWPAFALLQDQLTWWGLSFLAVGVGLLAVVTLAPGFGVEVLVHVCAGGLLLVLGAGLVRVGGWGGAWAYLILGLGTIVVPLLGRLDYRRTWLRADALAVLLALGALLSGTILLTSPGSFEPSRYDVVRPWLGFLGLAFCTSALLVCVSQSSRLVPPWVRRGAPILLGTVMFVYGALTSIPNHDWVIFYGGFGAALIVLSLLGARLVRVDPRSLRTRLALVLAAAVAVPLVAMVSVFAHNQEVQGIAEQLARQEAVASALADEVSDYVNLHHAAVKALAGQPGLLALSPSQQHAILQANKAAYPDVVGFGTVAADGEPIARGDDRTGTSWIGDVVFEAVRRTNQPAIGIRTSPVINRPIFTLGAPVLDADGHFAGMVSSSLESARIAAFLGRTDLGPATRTFMVDLTGRVIAHPEQDLVTAFADLSSQPSVAAMLADSAPAGALRIAGARGGLLAGYARVPALGWGVIVERPASAGLDAIHTKLDLVFGGLLLVIAAAAGFGVLAAGRLSRPLATLAVAVDRLATGDSTAPLPVAGFTEIVRLAATFSHLRKQLDARTAERELAEEALKHQALHDGLTGLANRILFTDRLDHAIARTDRHADSLAVLFLDLNDFKGINDNFGHEQGDVVLVAVAARLRACLRSADTGARFGGDEFTMLLEGIGGQAGAIRVAKRIGAELARPIQLAGREVVVTASIGIAVIRPRSSATQLLREADQAMYRAKRQGPGHLYEVFEPEPATTSTNWIGVLRPKSVREPVHESVA